MARSPCWTSRSSPRRSFRAFTHMDLFSGLFGDVEDDSMYVRARSAVNGAQTRVTEFDPSSASGKRWLEKMANKMAHGHEVPSHLEQCAARYLRSGCGEAQGRNRVAKKWLDGAAMLGAKSMRVNSGGPRIAPTPVADRARIRRTTISRNI